MTAITDSLGSVVERYTYDAFGKPTIWNSDYSQELTDSTIGNRYLFTGREYDKEVGLYYYRARHYDPQLGKFLQIDPIGYWDSMNLYSYVNNNPINWTDPWGLKAGDLFGTPDEAAKDFGKTYNDDSIRNNREYASSVYETNDDSGNTKYSYNTPNKGDEDSVTVPNVRDGQKRVGTAHSHAAYDKKLGSGNDNFSKRDKENAQKRGVPNYVSTPEGTLKKYDVKSKKSTTISGDIPSDPNHPCRKNAVSPTANSQDDEVRGVWDDVIDFFS